MIVLCGCAWASETPLSRQAYSDQVTLLITQLQHQIDAEAAVESSDPPGINAEHWLDHGNTLAIDPYARTTCQASTQDRLTALTALRTLLGTTANPRDITSDSTLIASLLNRRTVHQRDNIDIRPERPHFAEGLMDWMYDTTKDFLHWLGDRIKAILKWFIPNEQETTSDTGAGSALTLIVVICLIFITVITVVTSIMLIRRKRTAAIPIEAPQLIPQHEEAVDRTVSEWEQQALALAAAGRYRESIRAYYLATLATAFSLGSLHHRRGRTNWEYVRQVQPHLMWRSSFVTMVGNFERVWYGSMACSRSTCDQFAALAQNVGQALHKPTEKQTP